MKWLQFIAMLAQIVASATPGMVDDLFAALAGKLIAHLVKQNGEDTDKIIARTLPGLDSLEAKLIADIARTELALARNLT